jgi:TetR/AcrR family transcriptional regulator, cholesterol catabolism regulator
MSAVSPISLRERKKTLTRERIYRKALELFRHKGFVGTTVEEIAGAAEVAKGTFFNYFPTKEAVLNYLGERQVLACAEEIQTALGDPGMTAREKLGFVLRRLAANVEAERDLMRMAVFEAMKAPDVLAAAPYRGLLKVAVVRLVGEGQARGEVRPSLDPDLVGSAVAGLYLSQVFEWCAAPEPYALGDRLDGMLGMLWQGIGVEGEA